MKKYLLPLIILVIGFGYIAYTEKNIHNPNTPEEVKNEIETKLPITTPITPTESIKPVEVIAPMYQGFKPEQIKGYYKALPISGFGVEDTYYNTVCDTFIITKGNGPILEWLSSWTENWIKKTSLISKGVGTTTQSIDENMFQTDDHARIKINTQEISDTTKNHIHSSTKENPITITIGNLKYPPDKGTPPCFSWVDIIE